MKALSIRQPWAHAILHFGKRVENREWQTGGGNESQAVRLVGETIAIHAGKGCTVDEFEDVGLFMRGIYMDRPWDGSAILPRLKNPALVRGALVARARLASVTFTLDSGHRSADTRLRNGQMCALCGIDYAVGSCAKADPWAIPGCLGLVLADVEALPSPVPFKGALGFFDVPAEVFQ